MLCFFFKDTATTGIYTDCHPLSLRDALPICVVDLVRIPFVEQAAEPLDCPQRRAQVGGDAVGERLELLVGLGQLARAQRDAGLERAVARLARKSTRLTSSHQCASSMPPSACKKNQPSQAARDAQPRPGTNPR